MTLEPGRRIRPRQLKKCGSVRVWVTFAGREDLVVTALTTNWRNTPGLVFDWVGYRKNEIFQLTEYRAKFFTLAGEEVTLYPYAAVPV